MFKDHTRKIKSTAVISCSFTSAEGLNVEICPKRHVLYFDVCDNLLGIFLYTSFDGASSSLESFLMMMDDGTVWIYSKNMR